MKVKHFCLIKNLKIFDFLLKSTKTPATVISENIATSSDFNKNHKVKTSFATKFTPNLAYFPTSILVIIHCSCNSVFCYFLKGRLY